MSSKCFLCFAGIVLMSGCTTIERILGLNAGAKPVVERVIVRDNADQLKAIAECLGLRPSAAKSGDDIVTDIKLAVDKAERQMPMALSDETISKLEKLLKPGERQILRKYQQAIVDSQGKKVLYLPVDD